MFRPEKAAEPVEALPEAAGAPPPETLSVDVRLRLGAFLLDATFSSTGLTALFGRSGSGKTSLVNIIAGLARPGSGRVAVDGAVLVDTARRIFVPAHRRRVGYVFQEGRLFPHLTVRGNLTYGRWFTPRSERRTDFDRVVDLLGIAPLLERRPERLSGGEKQRVAIGRALLASPRLLLMDEPLASLDEGRKAEIFPYLERLRDEARIPIVYVSHSVPEVARLATNVVVLSEGCVMACGPAVDVMSRVDLFPLTGRADAGAILEAVVAGHDAAFGLTRLNTAAGALSVPGLELAEGTRLRVRIRARDVMLAVRPPEGLSALNVLSGQVSRIGPGAGPVVDVALDCGGVRLLARVTRRSVETLGIAPGRSVHAVIKSITFDRHSVGGAGRWSGETEG